MRKRRVVGRIYGRKYSWKGHKDRNRHKNRIRSRGQARLAYVEFWHKPQHLHRLKASLRGLSASARLNSETCDYRSEAVQSGQSQQVGLIAQTQDNSMVLKGYVSLAMLCTYDHFHIWIDTWCDVITRLQLHCSSPNAAFCYASNVTWPLLH